jgi:hypothetical protein
LPPEKGDSIGLASLFGWSFQNKDFLLDFSGGNHYNCGKPTFPEYAFSVATLTSLKVWAASSHKNNSFLERILDLPLVFFNTRNVFEYPIAAEAK